MVLAGFRCSYCFLEALLENYSQSTNLAWADVRHTARQDKRRLVTGITLNITI